MINYNYDCNKTLILIDFKSKDLHILSVDNLEAFKPLLKPTEYEHILEMVNDDKVSKKAIISTYTLFAEKLEVNEENYKRFISLYFDALKHNHLTSPDLYLKDFETTFTNMNYAILKGTYNKDSDSFKAVCKTLKIKHTYKAINAFIKGGV